MAYEDWRPILNQDRTPIQQSTIADPADFAHYSLNTLMVGVVLEVYPSDHVNNRSAIHSTSRRGFLHECTVMCFQGNASNNLLLHHVVITPDALSGVDDYTEHLPRGSSVLTSGREFTGDFSDVDPHDLDGDFCVVGFIGGAQDQPVILRWWPHPKNAYDPATSGLGNPDASGEPQALEQQNRYFRRINGVEYVITGEGDVVITTTYANSEPLFNEDQEPTKGRWGRQVDEDVGGSILAHIKPSQTLEISWDPVRDGVGVRMGRQAELPQTNPQTDTSNPSTQGRENSYIFVDKEKIKIEVPNEFRLKSENRIKIESDDTATLSASTTLELESETIKLGANAASPQGVVRGSDLKTWLENLTVLTAMGPAKINPADIATFMTQVVSEKVFVE